MISPKLLVMTDTSRFPDSGEHLAALCSWARPGSVALILRDREKDVRFLLEFGGCLAAATHRSGQYFFVSDRLDLARSLGADGAHLPANGVNPSRARAHLGKRAWISRAGHGACDLARAELAALTAVVLSPVMQARKGRAALGSDNLGHQARELRARAPNTLVYALGGVDSSNAQLCIAAGVTGVAAITSAHDPSEVKRLIAVLGIERA